MLSIRHWLNSFLRIPQLRQIEPTVREPHYDGGDAA